MPIICLFLKIETLESWDNWLLSNWSRFLNWKDLELSTSPPNCSKDSRKVFALVFVCQLAKFDDLMSCGSKDILKKCTVSCTTTHHDITDLVIHGVFENTKNWILWEQNITFLWNKKVLNLFLRWHILRSYLFVVQVI